MAEKSKKNLGKKKKKQFWSPLKIVITITLVLVLLFFLLKTLNVEFPFLTSSIDQSSLPVSGGIGNGGGSA